MNKILYTLLAILCIGISACSDDDAVEVASLNIVQSTVDFSAAGGEGFITLENGNDNLEVLSNMEWCSIKSVTSDKITFNVALNNDLVTRAAAITVKLGGEMKRVSITQSGVIAKYASDTFYRYSENVAFSRTINFTSTLPVSVSINSDAQDWLSYTNAEGGYVFTGTANDTGSARLGKATISSGSTSVDYYFYQYGIDDLLGQYAGAIQVYSDVFGLDGALPLEDNTLITSSVTGDGTYLIQLPMLNLLGAVLKMTATYRNGAFVITTPQQQAYQISAGYGSIIAKSDDGLYLQASILIAPTLLSNGRIGLVYGSDVYPILGLFKNRVPTANNYTGYSIDFPVLLMQKVVQ